MKRVVTSALFSVLGAAALFPAMGVAQEKPMKVAIVNIQQAIAQCEEGKQAASQLQAKFSPKRDDLEKQQREINDLQNQLKNQGPNLTDDARNRLLRSIDDKTKVFNRSNEDATNEYQQAEQDAINEIGRKMLAVIDEHAQKNGYTLVLDVSSPQTPVLYADAGLDITQKVVEQYNASEGKSKTGAAPAAPPAAAPSAAPKSAAPATAPKPAAPKP